MSNKKFIARHGVDANYNTISNVANPVNAQDAVTKTITDAINNTLNNAYGQANTATTNAATAYGQANTALDTAQSAYGQANTALGTAQSAYNNSNTKFSSSGGAITGPVEISSSLLVTGNVTFSGHVTTISANNIVSKDNMIYLNEGTAGNTNPDIGIAGAYYDTEYHHCGFFRDASDGIWKVFDNYKPEPDASVYIDTSNSTFRIADFQANNITANTLSGTANNANYFGGYAPSYYTDASNLSSGTVPIDRLSNIPNSSIANTSITINGTAIALGSSGSIVAGATITDDVTVNATRYLMLGPETSGSYTIANTSSTKLTFTPSTGTLFSSNVKTSGLYDNSDRRLIIEDANGVIVWG